MSRDLIVIIYMEIYFLVINFFFIDCYINFIVENRVKFIFDVFCLWFFGYYLMKRKYFDFNVCVYSFIDKFYGKVIVVKYFDF